MSQQEQRKLALDTETLELLEQGLKGMIEQRDQLVTSIHRQEGAVLFLRKLLKDSQVEPAEE